MPKTSLMKDSRLIGPSTLATPRTLHHGTALLLLTLLLLAGCGSRPQVPTVTPRSTQITGVVANGLAMRIDLLVYNPNGYDLTVRSMSARVTAQGTDLGTIQHAQQFNLPAGQNIPFVADVTVPWGDLPSLAASAILSPSIPYRVRGRVIAGRGNITVEAPFEIEGQIPRTMLLRIPGAAILPIKSESENTFAEAEPSANESEEAEASPPTEE